MGWMTKVILLLALQYISPSLCQDEGMLPLSLLPTVDDDSNEDDSHLARERYDLLLRYNNHNNNDNNVINNIVDPDDDDKLAELGDYLTKMLLLPNTAKGLPLLYMEETTVPELFGGSPSKRSRYYRKYPWKRQNARQTYDAENRYLCQPSKEDVFRLLVALHEARQGNKGQTINFCNRKRPATAIFTNIRFLG